MTTEAPAPIASVDCGIVWAQTFAYDAFGNINKSGSQAFTPGYSPQTNRMVSLPGSTPTYDLDGNVTYDGANTYGWDANGNMVTVNSTTSTFDALGRLASQTWPGEIMWLPAGLGRIFWHGQVADVTAFNLPGGDHAIISEASGVTRYAHGDHLGSGRLQSTTSGTYYESMAYAPYGETYAQSKFDAGLFTGEGVSFALGLYDSQTREFSDAGRWVSPDPAGVAAVDPTNPQSWNRYAYVLGQPLSLTDPTGMCGGSSARPCPPPPPPSDGGCQVMVEREDPLTEYTWWECEIGSAGPTDGGGAGMSGPQPQNPPPPPPKPKCAKPNWLNKLEIPILQDFAMQHHETAGIGLNLSGGLGHLLGFSGSVSGYLAVNENGNAFFVFSHSYTSVIEQASGLPLSPTEGVGILGGPSVLQSNAQSSDQMSGTSEDFGGSVADEFGVGTDVSLGPNAFSSTTTFGFGAGGSGHALTFQESTIVPVCGYNGQS